MGTYFKDIWEGIWTVLVGMKITWAHLFTPAVTIQYPEVKLKLPSVRVTACTSTWTIASAAIECSMACPVNCITIQTLKSTPDVDLGLTSVGTKKRLYVPVFDIDIAKCCYCGLCVPPCPTECIKMTDVFEFAEYQRTNLIYNFSTMTPAEIDAAKNEIGCARKRASREKSCAEGSHSCACVREQS